MLCSSRLFQVKLQTSLLIWSFWDAAPSSLQIPPLASLFIKQRLYLGVRLALAVKAVALLIAT
jgi:hypothetical protein